MVRTIYVVIVGGLLAFSSLQQRPDLATAILVTVLYVLFAYKNLGAIEDVTHERLAILQRIRDYHIEERESEKDARSAGTGADAVDVGGFAKHAHRRRCSHGAGVLGDGMVSPPLAGAPNRAA